MPTSVYSFTKHRIPGYTAGKALAFIHAAALLVSPGMDLFPLAVIFLLGTIRDKSNTCRSPRFLFVYCNVNEIVFLHSATHC